MRLFCMPMKTESQRLDADIHPSSGQPGIPIFFTVIPVILIAGQFGLTIVYEPAKR
jgi:hypothetical protein